MSNCTFTNNHAPKGDNVYWDWTVEDFLNKYSQINDYDYVYIRNGVGTPSKTIILNKKSITISSQGSVTFDAKGGNIHFEVTGSDVLIEKITFRNFNFTENGGAIRWHGKQGILTNCKFINNTAINGGCIRWFGANGTISSSTFTGNTAISAGGAVCWDGINGTIFSSTFNGNTAGGNGGGGVYWHNTASNGKLTSSIFTNNKANVGAGVHWWGSANGTLADCTFINNTATINGGGGIAWSGANGIITDSTFTNNNANTDGGGILWTVANGTLINSIFTNNTSIGRGNAIYWGLTGSMIDCTFNNKWTKSNGIYAQQNLIISNGKGIVDIVTQGTISGISVVVLNNETYYYPPSTNINFKDYFFLFGYNFFVNFVII